MQAVLTIEDLPGNALDAASAFYAEHMPRAQEQLAGGVAALVIALPFAPFDHDSWRRALARDLARTHAPQRVNVIGANDEANRDCLLSYVSDAPGITGQYLAAHE